MNRGDSGTAFVASGMATVIGAAYFACRLGWRDNPPGPVLLAIGVCWFLIHFAYGFRTLLAQRYPIHRDTWLLSDGALTFFAVLLLAAIGAVVGPFAAIPVAVCGTVVLLIRMRMTLPHARLFRLVFSAIGTVALALGLFAMSCSQHYHSPLFLESLAGGIGHSDTLHHAAYCNMIRTYGVPSTGLDGLPQYRYHFGSHWLFAQYSTLLDIGVIDFYQLGYAVIFLPLFVFAIGLAGTAFTGDGRTPIAWGVRTWVVVLAALVGWLPLTASQLTYLFFGWYPAVSESFGLSLTGLLLAVAAARPAWMRWRNEPASLTRLDRWAAVAVFPFVVAELMACKISVGPLLLVAAGYALVRAGGPRRSRATLLALGLSAIAVLLLIPQVYSTAYSDPAVKLRYFLTSGLVDARTLPIFPIILLAWFLLALRIRAASAGIKTFRDFSTGRLLDIECIAVVAVVGFTMAFGLRLRQDAYYFFDVQTWLALAALLGAMQSLPPWIAAVGPWWKRPGSLAPANIPLIAVMLTVLGVVGFRVVSEGYEFALDNLHTRGFRGPPPGEDEFPKRERIVEVEGPFRAGQFGTAWDRIIQKTRETEATPDAKRDVITLLKTLDRLPLAVKKRTVLHIPKTNRAYWDIFPPDHPTAALAGPFIGPAVSGLAMLEGLPDAMPTSGYGYVAYPPESFAPRPGDLVSKKAQLCDRAASLRFRRVIVIDGDSSGRQYLIEWPLGDAPAVLSVD